MRIIQTEPLSNADYLLTIPQIGQYYFETCSELKHTYNRPMHTDGLSAKKRVGRVGSSQVENVTLSKSFDDNLDKGLLEWLKTVADGRHFDVTIQPVRRTSDIEPGAVTFECLNCRLLESSLSAIDIADGETTSKLSFTFSVENLVYRGV